MKQAESPTTVEIFIVGFDEKIKLLCPIY